MTIAEGTLTMSVEELPGFSRGKEIHRPQGCAQPYFEDKREARVN